MIRQGQIGTKNLSKTLHFVCITRNTTFYILNERPRFGGLSWCQERDSNPRPPAYENVT